MDERTESLLLEVNKLHARKELSQTVGVDFFEPGMMEYLDQSEGLFDIETGEVLLRFEVKGTRYEGRTEQIEKVQLYDEVLVRRDENNSYNANNFELLTSIGKSLGNMPAELCNAIAPLYDSGELRLQKAHELSTQHYDAEIGCLDYKVIKALAATYELQDYLANRIAKECLDEDD